MAYGLTVIGIIATKPITPDTGKNQNQDIPSKPVNGNRVARDTNGIQHIGNSFDNGIAHG